MQPIRSATVIGFALLVILSSLCAGIHAQAALLMEEPYGFFGALNPTGHNAIYFDRICAATPVTLRRCQPGEMGAVISRYQGINGHDWIAIPLIPYLYAVEHASDVPDHVNRELVAQLRNRYRETHLESLGKMSEGTLVHGGWPQLIGAAYERRIYAFSFSTTPEQDDALIARLNDSPNRSHFNLMFRNCADFARVILNDYFPKTFHRGIFPDAGMTSPKHNAFTLVRYARKHPEVNLTVFVIPQVPGYRRSSRFNKGIDESFITTAYAIPIVLLNPYLAGGLFADFVFRGHYHFVPKNPSVLGPGTLSALTTQARPAENSASLGSDTVNSTNPSPTAGLGAEPTVPAVPDPPAAQAGELVISGPQTEGAAHE